MDSPVTGASVEKESIFASFAFVQVARSSGIHGSSVQLIQVEASNLGTVEGQTVDIGYTCFAELEESPHNQRNLRRV
jgi:hypothetical protein